jgi:hypothetical protein
VAVVVVNPIDRVSRSIKDFYEFFANCDKSGVTFVATAQQIDSSTAAGKLILAISVTFAAFEADVASGRVSATFGEHHIRTMVCLAPVYAGHLVEGRGKDLDRMRP